jgi:hypothetical protein
MTSRDGRGFTKRWFIAGAAATLLAAGGARAEEARAEVKQPDAQAAHLARANGGTGSAAPAEVSDGSGSGAVSAKTATSPARRGAAPAAERGRTDYDEARELASGNSGGRG